MVVPVESVGLGVWPSTTSSVVAAAPSGVRWMHPASVMDFCSAALLVQQCRRPRFAHRPVAGKARWNVPKAPTSSVTRWRSSRTTGKSRAAPRCARVGRRGPGGAADRDQWSCRPDRAGTTAARDATALPRLNVVFGVRQCDKKNHGWREGPPL